MRTLFLLLHFETPLTLDSLRAALFHLPGYRDIQRVTASSGNRLIWGGID